MVLSLLLVAALLLRWCPLAGAQPSSTAAATQQTFTGVDITAANLTNCGANNASSGACVVCKGGVEAVAVRCKENPKCLAFTWDGTCGYLKGAALPRVKRAGIISVVLPAAPGSSDVITAAQRGNDSDSSAGGSNTVLATGGTGSGGVGGFEFANKTMTQG